MINAAYHQFVLDENKFLRNWVRELIQERDSLKADLTDLRDDIDTFMHRPSRHVAVVQPANRAAA